MMAKTIQFRPRLPKATQERIKKGGAHRNRKQFNRAAQKRADRRGEYSSPLPFRDFEVSRFLKGNNGVSVFLHLTLQTEERNKMRKDGKFDAKFQVMKPINLVLHDEEPLHDGSTIWCGPDATLYTIEPGVYYVDGLNLDAEGCPQDKYYWGDNPDDDLKARRIPSLGIADLRALEREWECITLLEGSFDSNDPDKR
jgi:hypothetical protein